MKSINKQILTWGLMAALAIVAPSCNSILEEHPYTVFTTDYFKTAQGLQDGINAVYAGLKYNYGPEGALTVANVGTDEWTYGDAAPGDVSGLGKYSITTTIGPIATPWNRSFQWINSCNAIIQFAPNVDLPDADRSQILGEAHYMRALLYMNLVQHFGAVPLNLGSGDLAFNTTPSTKFYRGNTDEAREAQLAANYQVIIDDLIFATQNLKTVRDADNFILSKAAAYHLLARAYIHRGYSTAADGNDFSNAYDAAMELIDKQDVYGVELLPNFKDVFKEGNDYNREILFSVERMPLNNVVNGTPTPQGDFASQSQIACNEFICNYQQATFPNLNKQCIPNRVLTYGRELRRFAPTLWTVQTAFGDKVNDSRFDNTFRTVWYAATLEAPGTTNYNTYVNDLASIGLAIGDTAIYLAPTDAKAAELKPIKEYRVLGPSEYYTNQNTTWRLYPSLTKYQAEQRAHFNDVSGRPYPVSRMGEVYLLAAEAAMKEGDNAEAARLINVLRLRAAFRPGLTAQQIQDRYALIDVGADEINLDFILDERLRELCGEGVRWADLAVRGKLIERVLAHNPDAQGIQPHHVLRPIPQSQLDAISDPDPQSYQNKGY